MSTENYKDEACEWCGAEGTLIKEHKDMFGNKVHICLNCYDTYTKGVCRKCGDRVIPESTIKGVCIKCMQKEAYEKAKKLDEVKMGLISEQSEGRSGGLTDEEYDSWMNFGPKLFDSEMLKNSSMLRQVWAVIKLKAAGIDSEKEMCDTMPLAMFILESNFSDIIGNKCKFIFVRDEQELEELKSSEIIASKDGLFLVKE